MVLYVIRTVLVIITVPVCVMDMRGVEDLIMETDPAGVIDAVFVLRLLRVPAVDCVEVAVYDPVYDVFEVELDDFDWSGEEV